MHGGRGLCEGIEEQEWSERISATFYALDDFDSRLVQQADRSQSPVTKSQ